MAIKLHLEAEARAYLQTMANEAGLTIHDMVEISVYNLIALYIRDRSPPLPLDTHDALVGDH